jgi:hypothetical protein
MSFSIKKTHKYCNQYPDAPKDQDFQVDAQDLGISFSIEELIEKDSNVIHQQPIRKAHTGGQVIRTGPLAQMDFY